jgi:hypothetical protein
LQFQVPLLEIFYPLSLSEKKLIATIKTVAISGSVCPVGADN